MQHNKKFWFQTDLRRENTLLTIVTRWSRSTSNFYTLIGQNLTGELMRKSYAASWILFTFTAEAVRVLCELVMFLTVFFHWMYKNEIQLLSGVFRYPWSWVCLMGFWLRHTSLGKVGNPISPCLMRKQSGISPNLRTGSTGHATLFNQWEGALVFIKLSTQWSKILTPVDGVGQILRYAYSARLGFTLFQRKQLK